MCYNAKDLLARAERMPEDPACYWAHRVADRAIDFIRQAGAEPDAPYCAPPSCCCDLDPAEFPIRPSFNKLGTGKPELQTIAAAENGLTPERDLRNYYRMSDGCNRFVDSEIGRVLAAVPEPMLLAACGIAKLNPLSEQNRIKLTQPAGQLRDQHPWIDRLHGVNLAPVLRDPTAQARDQLPDTLLSFMDDITDPWRSVRNN